MVTSSCKLKRKLFHNYSGFYLDQTKNLLLNDLRRVVFRPDDLDEILEEVFTGDCQMETSATVLDTRLQQLTIQKTCHSIVMQDMCDLS